MEFVGFPDIEGFHNVVRAVAAYPHIAKPPVNYRAKIKLHGTNAGVRVKDGVVVAQSRTQLITPQSDNAGFARWLQSKEDLFRGIKLNDVTVFGEWCGPGIMKGTAINKIPGKIFAIFAVVVANTEMIVCPEQIRALFGELPPDVHVLPWYGKILNADFDSRESLRQVAEVANGVVTEVEPCDPWIKATFGVEGTGEGVVYYPSVGQTIPRKRFSDLAFKAKGEKHQVVHTKEAVQVDPEVAASIEEFVMLFVTEPRLEQGVAATGGVYDMKNMGPFLKWLSGDVLKESKAELEASGLTWNQVQKVVQTAARAWYMGKSKTI